MSVLQYVTVDEARAAGETCLVTTALVPSPWSEAAKGLFEVAKLPALVVAGGRDRSAIQAWTGAENVPVVLHRSEPVRTNWAAIVGLVARLAPGSVVPRDPAARADMFGFLDLVAGEEGIGWNARWSMIEASLESDGKRGFPLPVANVLAARYRPAPGDAADRRARIEMQLRLLAERLAGRGQYFGGAAPDALDVYVATFLTPLTDIDAEACPTLHPALRSAFGSAREAFGSLVPESLWAHRKGMFAQHLTWPIKLS